VSFDVTWPAHASEVCDCNWVAAVGDGDDVVGIGGDAVAAGGVPEMRALAAAGTLARAGYHALAVALVLALVVGARSVLACGFAAA
jgi:hypothetical protein